MIYRGEQIVPRMVRESRYGSTLCHFNPYHDPKNGQFTEPSGSGNRRQVIVSPNRSSISAPVKNNTSSSAQNNANANVNDNDNKNREKLKKALKIGGIALGSALVILGARYLIDDAVQTYAKKHNDIIIKAGTTIATLSFNPDDTINPNTMFYASHIQRDRTLYEALFNKPVSELKDRSGKVIASGGSYLKKRILRTVTEDVRVANEDDGIRAFSKLCRTDPKFSDWVFGSGMQSQFEEHRYRYSGYRRSRRELDKVRRSVDRSRANYGKIYAMFNYVLTKRASSEQRAKFFAELGRQGFDAVLDTNDAIYGAYKSQQPVIMYNMAKVAPLAVEQTLMNEHRVAQLKLIANKTLGLNI